MSRATLYRYPTEDAAWVGQELTRRFGVGSWQFALSATDANRWALRLARHVTGRPKVVVHDRMAVARRELVRRYSEVV